MADAVGVGLDLESRAEDIPSAAWRLLELIAGLLIGAIPTVMVFLGLAHVNLGQDQLTAIVDAIVSLVQGLLMVISALATLYGLGRKVWLTLFPAKAA